MYISEDLARNERLHAKVGMGGICFKKQNDNDPDQTPQSDQTPCSGSALFALVLCLTVLNGGNSCVVCILKRKIQVCIVLRRRDTKESN